MRCAPLVSRGSAPQDAYRRLQTLRLRSAQRVPAIPASPALLLLFLRLRLHFVVVGLASWVRAQVGFFPTAPHMFDGLCVVVFARNFLGAAAGSAVFLFTD